MTKGLGHQEAVVVVDVYSPDATIPGSFKHIFMNPKQDTCFNTI